MSSGDYCHGGGGGTLRVYSHQKDLVRTKLNVDFWFVWCGSFHTALFVSEPETKQNHTCA